MIKSQTVPISAGGDAATGGTSSYPGGKSGAGIYQRIINLIPRHRILIVPFAGHCGVVRNIRPAKHTVVIDQDPAVCEWWSRWSRTKQGRALEIHHCDGIEWLRFHLGLTEYSAAGSAVPRSCDMRSRVTGSRLNPRLVMPGAFSPGCDANCSDGRLPRKSAATAIDAEFSDPAATHGSAAEAFVFGDPPYVLSERASGRIYEHELLDTDHQRLLGVLTAADASRYQIMVCGYACDLYASLDPWQSIDHRVPTRGGLQDERIWMNYPNPVRLHDYQYLGDGRRSRERIRRRQRNWVAQLEAMGDRERAAMLEALSNVELCN